MSTPALFKIIACLALTAGCNGAIGGADPNGSQGAAGSTGNGSTAGVPGSRTAGAAGAGGTTTAGAGSGGTSAGVPCDVQAVFQTHCMACHGSPPTGGAPMSLVSYADLTRSSSVNPAMTNAQRALTRMQDNTSPMPPAPSARVAATEIQTVSAWISAGYPMGNCGGTGADGGTGGSGAGTPDPLNAQPVCTSKTSWTGGDNGSANMNPGLACINCHASTGGEAPTFNIAGTLYPTGHEPDLCNGVNGGTAGAQVVIVDAANRTLTLTPNGVGNFTYAGALTTPFHVKVTYQGRERIMSAAQTSGDCNSCHTQGGASGAPGRITLP